MKSIKALVLIVGFTLFTNSYACNVKVSWEPWVPYQFKEGSSDPSGLDIDLLRAVLADAGCTPVFVELPWTRGLIESEIGNIDIVMGASKSPEREKYASFTLGYRNEISSLFLKKGEGADIKKVSDLGKTKLRIGVVKGNLYSPEVDAMISKFDASANNDDTNLKKFLANRLDGFLADRYTGLNLIKKSNAMESIVQHPLNVSTSEVYFMISKKSKIKDLPEMLSKSIKKLKSKKVLAKIISKYE